MMELERDPSFFLQTCGCCSTVLVARTTSPNFEIVFKRSANGRIRNLVTQTNKRPVCKL
jgi:hypothetical protein